MSKSSVHHKSPPNRWTRLLAAVHVVTCAVRLRRRRVFPITRLPNELLGHVFFFLAYYEPPFKTSHTPRPRRFSIGWIKVTHVCRHWREVALDHSQLWSCIAFDLGREWSLKMIARAKQAPLDIYSEDEAEPLLALVVPSHLSHTQSLHILNADLNVVHLMTTAAAPNLERLLLLSTMVGENPVISLPEDIFAFHAPRLRTAFFSGFKVPWSSPLIRNLSTLQISIPRLMFNESPVPSLPSQREVFDALADMPYLESLTIYFALPSFVADAIEPQRKESIVLPHLLELTLGGPWLDVVAVLEVTQFPPLTMLDLDFFAEEDNDSPVNVIFPLLQSYRDMLPGINSHPHLSIESTGRGRYWLYTQNRIPHLASSQLRL